jgi:hypothetical protein
MTKVIDCALIEPGWTCGHFIRATTEAETLRLAMMHARSHGVEPSPALPAQVRAAMRDEDTPPSVWDAAVPDSLSQGPRSVVARRHPVCIAGGVRPKRTRPRRGRAREADMTDAGRHK